jgi:antitoxin FitA
MAKTKMVQLRNFPEALHRVVKARAAMAGMSLSEYLINAIAKAEEGPTIEELRESLRKREPVSLPISAAEAVRQEREAR